MYTPTKRILVDIRKQYMVGLLMKYIDKIHLYITPYQIRHVMEEEFIKYKHTITERDCPITLHYTETNVRIAFGGIAI